MNEPDIKKWLNQLLPVEKELKNWYDIHHFPMPLHIYFSRLKHFQEICFLGDPTFSVFDPERLPLSKSLSDHIFTIPESICFHHDENISITKHPRYFPEFSHSNSCVEITYVLSGTCTQTFYREQEKETIILNEGDFCIVQPFFNNAKGVYDDNTIVLNIMVRKRALLTSFAEFISNAPLLEFFNRMLYQSETENFLIFRTNGDAYIRESILKMMVEISKNDPYNQKILFFMLGLLFLTLQRDYIDTIQFSQYSSPQYSYIPRFNAYIEKHYKDFSLSKMSDHFHLSASHISRLYCQNTASTITHRLITIRLNAAKLLLKNTQMKVHDISNYIGYEDCTYFIRIFKRNTGYTPLQYRKNVQSNPNNIKF